MGRRDHGNICGHAQHLARRIADADPVGPLLRGLHVGQRQSRAVRSREILALALPLVGQRIAPAGHHFQTPAASLRYAQVGGCAHHHRLDRDRQDRARAAHRVDHVGHFHGVGAGLGRLHSRQRQGRSAGSRQRRVVEEPLIAHRLRPSDLDFQPHRLPCSQRLAPRVRRDRHRLPHRQHGLAARDLPGFVAHHDAVPSRLRRCRRTQLQRHARRAGQGLAVEEPLVTQRSAAPRAHHPGHGRPRNRRLIRRLARQHGRRQHPQLRRSAGHPATRILHLDTVASGLIELHLPEHERRTRRSGQDRSIPGPLVPERTRARRHHPQRYRLPHQHGLILHFLRDPQIRTHFQHDYIPRIPPRGVARLEPIRARVTQLHGRQPQGRGRRSRDHSAVEEPLKRQRRRPLRRRAQGDLRSRHGVAGTRRTRHFRRQAPDRDDKPALRRSPLPVVRRQRHLRRAGLAGHGPNCEAAIGAAAGQFNPADRGQSWIR